MRIEEELQIKNLHPKIESVQIPRQKRRNWCFVTFSDPAALEHLRHLKIEGKKVVVKKVKKRERKAKPRPSFLGKEKASAAIDSCKPPTDLLRK